MATLSIVIDGKQRRLLIDRMIIEDTGEFFPWHSCKKVRTPTGLSLKTFDDHLVTSKQIDRLVKVIESLSSGDPLLDLMLCRFERALEHGGDESLIGVFRIPGDASRVKAVMKTGRVDDQCTIHDLASCIKQRVAELGDSIDGDINTQRWFAAVKRILQKVVRKTEQTRMTVESLAIVFAPCLYRLTGTIEDLQANTRQLSDLMRVGL